MIKEGDTVKLTWRLYAHTEKHYLVQITKIEAFALYGFWASLDVKGVTEKENPFPFEWNKIVSIESTTEVFPSSDEVVLNEDCVAKVGKDTTTVGCQSIPNSKILEVAELIKKQERK